MCVKLKKKSILILVSNRFKTLDIVICFLLTFIIEISHLIVNMFPKFFKEPKFKSSSSRTLLFELKALEYGFKINSNKSIKIVWMNLFYNI